MADRPNGEVDSHGMLTCDHCQRIAPPDILTDLCPHPDEAGCEISFYYGREATDAG